MNKNQIRIRREKTKEMKRRKSQWERQKTVTKIKLAGPEYSTKKKNYNEKEVDNHGLCVSLQEKGPETKGK